MVDRENLFRPAPELSGDRIPAIEEIPADVLAGGDPLDGELAPFDRPSVVTDWGTTVAEQLASEPLDIRIAREEPEYQSAEAYADRQFLEPGAILGLGDAEADMFGDSDGGFGDTLSAEEAAMRIVEEPPGMNYDPDPGYLDHGRD